MSDIKIYATYITSCILGGILALAVAGCGTTHPIPAPPITNAISCDEACSRVSTCPFYSHCLATCESINDINFDSCLGTASTCEEASMCDTGR